MTEHAGNNLSLAQKVKYQAKNSCLRQNSVANIYLESISEVCGQAASISLGQATVTKHCSSRVAITEDNRSQRAAAEDPPRCTLKATATYKRQFCSIGDRPATNFLTRQQNTPNYCTRNRTETQHCCVERKRQRFIALYCRFLTLGFC